MGLPVTFAGIAGLIIAVVFIVAMAAPDLYPDETQGLKNSQAQFLSNLNATANTTVTPSESPGFWNTVLGITGLDGIYLFLTNILSMAVSLISMGVQAVLIWFGIAASIPVEFYVLFAIVGMSFIVAFIKIIWWGE